MISALNILPTLLTQEYFYCVESIISRLPVNVVSRFIIQYNIDTEVPLFGVEFVKGSLKSGFPEYVLSRANAYYNYHIFFEATEKALIVKQSYSPSSNTEAILHDLISLEYSQTNPFKTEALDLLSVNDPEWNNILIFVSGIQKFQDLRKLFEYECRDLRVLDIHETIITYLMSIPCDIHFGLHKSNPELYVRLKIWNNDAELWRRILEHLRRFECSLTTKIPHIMQGIRVAKFKDGTDPTVTLDHIELVFGIDSIKSSVQYSIKYLTD